MSTKFYPGWKMTVAQHAAYFRLLSQVYEACGLPTAEDREDMRFDIHLRAFGEPRSAKLINHLKDFDDFKAACLANMQPANLGAQMRQAEMPKTRLIYAIRKLAPEAYIISECWRKFGVEDWESLGESHLTMLRNHLAARAAKIRWPDQKSSPQAERSEAIPAGDGDPDWRV